MRKKTHCRQLNEQKTAPPHTLTHTHQVASESVAVFLLSRVSSCQHHIRKLLHYPWVCLLHSGSPASSCKGWSYAYSCGLYGNQRYRNSSDFRCTPLPCDAATAQVQTCRTGTWQPHERRVCQTLLHTAMLITPRCAVVTKTKVRSSKLQRWIHPLSKHHFWHFCFAKLPICSNSVCVCPKVSSVSSFPSGTDGPTILVCRR